MMSASDIPVISGNPDDDNPPLSPRTNYGDDDNSPLCDECLCDRDNCECFVCPDCDSPWDNVGTCNCDALNGSSQKDKPIAKICMVCPPGTVHNPPLLKLSNLSSHYRNFHRNDDCGNFFWVTRTHPANLHKPQFQLHPVRPADNAMLLHRRL